MYNAHLDDSAVVAQLPENILLEGNFKTGEIKIDGKYLSPEPSKKIRNHSPDGFMWGYGGSGPAQLALAILLKYSPQPFAMAYYQNFKFYFIGALPQMNFKKSVNLRQLVTNMLASKTYKRMQQTDQDREKTNDLPF